MPDKISADVWRRSTNLLSATEKVIPSHRAEEKISTVNSKAETKRLKAVCMELLIK